MYKKLFHKHKKIYPMTNINNININNINNKNDNKNIYIYEMFMRDGLQSLKTVYDLDTKIIFINNLIKVLDNIEFGSTTNSKLLPQMKDTYLLWESIKEYKFDKKLTILVTSNQELINSINKGIISFGLMCSICDIFGLSNLRKTSSESFEYMMSQINIIYSSNKYNKDDIHIRLYLSCSFDISNLSRLYNYITNINDIIKYYNILPNNIDIVLCDTIGNLTEELLEVTLQKITIIKDIIPYIALHIHTDYDFYNYIDIGLKYNISKYDSSLLNIGGCPYSGKDNIQNINSINLIEYLESKNYNTNIDVKLLKYIENIILKSLV